MVSVITLTYKNFDGLLDTIASVLNQDWPEFEYIISDDGSGNFPKEKVMDFVEKNKKKNITNFELILNENNCGTVKHLNNVLKKCHGEYIFDISSSDMFIDQHAISRIMNAFESDKCDVIVASRVDYKNSKIIETCPHFYDWKNVKKLDTREKRLSAFFLTQHFDMFIAPNVIYKKSVIERNDFFDENYKLLEDAPMIAKLLWNEKVSLRPDLFCVLYECKNGVSARGSKNRFLIDDLKRYNLIEKEKYYKFLDKKTQNHIKFGIEREKSTSLFHTIFLCIKYFPRIFSYLFYNIVRKFKAFGDYKLIKKMFVSGQLKFEK